MNDKLRFVFIFVVTFGVVLLTSVGIISLATGGVSWLVGEAGLDCSTVSYDGDGTEANPYEVSNVDQLQCISEQGLDANYVQVSDVDASETSEWNSNRGFDPISAFNRGFNGTFSGRGYNITDLIIYRREAGLFRQVNEGGEVTNVSLVNAEITTAGGEEASIAGTLVALNMGTISDSYATGTVNKRGVGGSPNRQGGLVGDNFGTIERSHASVSVDGEDTRMGGLVGLNSGIINSSYATGPIDGSNDVGGLVGVNKGTVTNSYWDIETTGQSTSAGNGTGLNTSEMTGSAARGNMTGFNFTNTWRTVPGAYPALRKGAATRRER